MHEIVTLQLGQRANYLGTHFWNSQESYFTYSTEEGESLVDHDIHFRPGRGPDGTETYTPRTVIYDLKGGFGSLRKINALYEEVTGDGPLQTDVWNGGPMVMQRQPTIPINPYQQSLEEGAGVVPASSRLTPETVRYWSDFNRVYFHPRSIVQLNEYDLHSSLMPFEKFGKGEELFDVLDKEVDLLDRDLRPFAEEADYMQGIQIMVSLDDAWGGFATKYLDRIRDEFGKTSVWIWGLEENGRNVPRAKQLLHISNTAQSIAGLAPQASLLIPMASPTFLPSYTNIQRGSLWHTSALFSTAMESVTLPSRLKSKNGIRHTLDDLAASLNVNGNQNIAKLQMTIAPQKGDSIMENIQQSKDIRMPAADGRAEQLPSSENEEVVYDMSFFVSENPTGMISRIRGKQVHVFGQSDVYRSTDTSETARLDDRDGHDRARRRAAGQPIINRLCVPLSYSLLDSFPEIYNIPFEDMTARSISVSTSLTTDSTVALRVKGLRLIASRFIGIEDREALTNLLGEIAEAYEEGYDSGSDSDDD